MKILTLIPHSSSTAPPNLPPIPPTPFKGPKYLPISKPPTTTFKPISTTRYTLQPGTFRNIFIPRAYTPGKPVSYVYPTYTTRSTTPWTTTTTPLYQYAVPENQMLI